MIAERFRSIRVLVASIVAILAVFSWLAWSNAQGDNEQDLDLQLIAIATEVEEQLGKKDIPVERARAGAENFRQGLEDILDKPFTEQQHREVLTSLTTHWGFLLTHDLYQDPTELEIEYCRLMWVDMIRQYTERTSLTEQERVLIKDQIDNLLLTAQEIAIEAAPSDAERDRVSNGIEYGRGLLYQEMDDPVMPVLKRPLTNEEIDELAAYLARTVPAIIVQPDGHPGDNKDGSRLFPVMNTLWGKVWSTYYQRPSLSPEDMKRMREERRELNRIRLERHRSEEEPQG